MRLTMVGRATVGRALPAGRALAAAVPTAGAAVRSRWHAFAKATGLRAVTAIGWSVLFGSALAWYLGAKLNWIELSFAAVTGVVAFGLCVLFTIGRAELTIDLVPERRRLVAGQSTTVAVTVTNAARRRLLPLRLEVTVGTAFHTFDLPGLATGAVHPTGFELTGVRRGVIPVGPATTVRGDPLGLLQRRVAWPQVTELFVHPATIRLEPLGAGLLRDLEGRATNEISMSDLAFHALREYVPGDDRRYIHWRSSAKVGSAVPGGKFLVRQFRDTRRTHLLVIVDGDPAAYADPEDFETAISVGASVAVRAVDDKLDTSVLVAGVRTREEHGRSQTKQGVLDTFSRAQPKATPLADLVRLATRVAPEATFALIVTGANPSFPVLRRVASHLSPVIGVAALRVDPGAIANISTGSRLTLMTLTKLDELRPLLARREGK